MFIGSENQFRHLFVVKSVENTIDDTKNVGSIKPVLTKDGKAFYFEYKDNDNVLRSDIIELDKVMFALHVKAKSMQRVAKSVDITIPDAPVVGQDYVIHIQVQNYIGLGDDLIHTKFGAAHAVKGMTSSDLYKELALSMARNFKNEAQQLVKIRLIKADGVVDVDANTKATSLTEDYTGINITEARQPWRLGVYPEEPVYFSVIPSQIMVDGEYVDFAKITKATDDNRKGAVYGNGRHMADLEWFYHGNRGDFYRERTYPDNFPFTPIVDKDAEYDSLEIHYYWHNDGINVGRSERTITLIGTDLTNLLDKFGTGKTIPLTIKEEEEIDPATSGIVGQHDTTNAIDY